MEARRDAYAPSTMMMCGIERIRWRTMRPISLPKKQWLGHRVMRQEMIFKGYCDSTAPMSGADPRKGRPTFVPELMHGLPGSRR